MERNPNIDDIKERVDLVSLVSRYVPLKQAGRNFKGLCPFHQEKTPSFNVSREYNHWRCWGCGASGDAFTFLERIEGLSFVEAAERLGREVGIQFATSPTHARRASERDLIARANEVAANFFARSLLKGPQAEQARAYLEQRAFTEETVVRFRLGYASPEWEDLHRELARAGTSPEVAVRAGLVRKRDTGGCYDYFRHRIMFPIVDVQGRILGFGGRALDPDDSAKYINSPETPLFVKRKTLYGLDLAYREIAQQERTIVVEGYTDVISLHQAGIANVVATLGTALTEDHARLLSRYAGDIVVAYDADSAGMQAVVRGSRSFENASAELRVARMPEGQDPDDCVRQGGPEAFLALANEAVSLVEYRLGLIFDAHADEGPDGRLRAVREAAAVLRELSDSMKRVDYARRAAERWAGGRAADAARMERALLFELRGAPQAEPTPAAHAHPGDTRFIAEALQKRPADGPAGLQRAGRDLLTAMLAADDIARRALDILGPASLPTPAQQGIVHAIAKCMAEATDYSARAVLEQIDEPASRELALELLLADEHAAELDRDALLDQAQRLRQAWAAGGEREIYREGRDWGAEPAPAERLEFEDLERRVKEGLAAGTLSSDDPAFVKYNELRRRFHGKGQLKFWRGSGTEQYSQSSAD